MQVDPNRVQKSSNSNSQFINKKFLENESNVNNENVQFQPTVVIQPSIIPEEYDPMLPDTNIFNYQPSNSTVNNNSNSYQPSNSNVNNYQHSNNNNSNYQLPNPNINSNYQLPNPNINSNYNSELVRWKPDVIVLGPGGMKGFLHLGCLIPFEQLHILDNIKIMVGVSVGSIILLLYLIGYTVDEIIQEGLNIKVEDDFIDFNIDNLKARGLFSINKLANKLIGIVERQLGYVPSLKQLYLLNNIRFVVISSKLPGSEVRIDYISDPDLSCVDAVIFSSTIPFVFTPKTYKDMILYDGALTNPYPTNIFDNGVYYTIGFYITADEHVEEGIMWLINTLTRIPMKQLRIVNQHNASERVKHIELTSPTMDFTGVSSDVDEKNGMIKEGFKKAVELLSGLGYNCDHLDVNQYLEIPYDNKKVEEKQMKEKKEKDEKKIIENRDNEEYDEQPDRYLYVDVDPHLYDHQSSDQLGRYSSIPQIDFSIMDPEIEDEEDGENNNNNNGNNEVKDLNTQISSLLSSLQNYLDKK